MLFSERKAGKKKRGGLDVLNTLCLKHAQDFLFETKIAETWDHTKTYRYNREVLNHYFLRVLKDPRFTPDNFGGAETIDELFDYLECTYKFLEKYGRSSEKFPRQELFEVLLNETLGEWGYRMQEGIISKLPEEGMEELVEEKVATDVIPSTQEKIDHATKLFLKREATEEDKKGAIKALGDLLEHVRDALKTTALNVDEGDIFNILNNFGIRHHNASQKNLTEPYLSWTFYTLLNTVKTFLKISEAKATK